MILLLVGCSGSTDDGAPESTAEESAPTATPRSGPPQSADIDSALEVSEAAALGSPGTVELGVLDSEVEDWLRSDGAPLPEFTRTSAPLWADGADACAEVAAALSATGSPDNIEALAASAPDGVLADVAGGLYRAVARALIACGNPEEFELRRAELAWQWVVATRLFESAGVA